MREKCISFAQFVHIFFERSVFTFQFLNDEIHNYVKKRDDCEFHHSKIEK